MQQSITPEFIKSCLLSMNDYKNTRWIKQAVQENQEITFDIICETIKEVLITDQHSPMAKLFAMRLSKDLVDIFNMRFVQKFEIQTLESLKYYAEFGDPKNETNRGTNLFGENMEKDIKQIGVSLVRLASECIHAWAQFFPLTTLGGPTNFIKLYLEIKKKGYIFPSWTYYKEEFVKNNQNNQFTREVNLLLSQQEMKSEQVQLLDSVKPIQPIQVVNPQQQSNINITQTPISQTPGNQENTKINCVQKSKLVIDRCRKLIDEVGDICSKTLICEPQMFQLQRDEAFAKNEEMDILVNELIDHDEENLAGEAMIQMDYLQELLQDLNNLNKDLSNQEFRKKYIKNKRDFAQEQFQQLQSIQQREIERQEALKRQQVEQENAKEQARILQELEAKSKQQQEQREREIQQYILEQQKEDQRKRKEQEKLEQLEREQQRLIKEQNEKFLIQEEEEKKKKEYEIQKKKEEQDLLEKQRREEELRLLKQKYEQELKEKELKEKEQERRFKQQQEELRKNDLEQQQQKIIDLQRSYQQNQISQSDLQKAQELVGTSNIKMQNSQLEYPLDRSQIQNKIRKPISQSSQGRNLQPQNQKIKGDFSGAPDMIKENKSQINQFEKNQIEILLQQVQNLQRDKQQIQKQLEETSERNKQWENMYSLNGDENRIQEDLKNLQKKFDQLQQEKNSIQNQLTINKQQFDDYKINNERMKQQQREQSDLELNNFKIERQQLFSEKQDLLRQLNQMQTQQTNNVDQQDKTTQNEQLISQLRREIEYLKQEKLNIQQRLQEDVDQNRLLLNEKSSFSEALNKQLNIYKAQLEKSSQDYLNIQEYQKKQSEQLLIQVQDARKESMNSKQQINIIQLQLSDKEAENRQLQQSYQAALKENQQLKKNLETAQQQIDQFISNNMDNRSSTLLQQKLQQKLDEIDKLKEDHKIAFKEKDDYYKQRIEDLTQEKQKLQKDLFELQQQVQQHNVVAMEAIQKQVQQKFRVSSKNNSKSQMSELESIQQLKQLENSDVKVSFFQEQKVFQCPITQFKHFPANKKFSLEQVIQKQKNINPESLELIFPYQCPEDYFNNKQQKTRKGRLIIQTQNFDEISHLNKENINFFKQRCLGTQGILFEEYGVQFGLMYQTQVQKNKSYFTYGLYIKSSTQDMKYNFTVQFLEREEFQQFWADPIEFSKTLDENSNDLIEIVVESNKIPQQILTLQISYSDIHPFQIYIPNHICQQIVYKEIKVNEFQSKWKQQIQNQIRTSLLNINKEVIKDIYNFQKQISKIIILNINKINDFELGIDEIKLGGSCTYSDISFLIKFEILPNDKICIYLTFESQFNSQRQTLENILNGYALILGEDDKVQ
ncbi:unnamed protein product [Paramecium sonneborni]|uniref:Uncharacterized protein n=1 Tax=Paramecium sonneborni TaxID=65129 RepID=A0A8S1N2X3_9CILI|nr:unnamed protein product [Paramecium sonneborni]